MFQFQEYIWTRQRVRSGVGAFHVKFKFALVFKVFQMIFKVCFSCRGIIGTDRGQERMRCMPCLSTLVSDSRLSKYFLPLFQRSFLSKNNKECQITSCNFGLRSMGLVPMSLQEEMPVLLEVENRIWHKYLVLVSIKTPT